MSLSSVPYFFASCSGKTNNLRTPKCLIEGPGSFDENEAADSAVSDGWFLGPKNYCPAHRDQAPSASTESVPAAPSRRRKKEPETLSEIFASGEVQNA